MDAGSPDRLAELNLALAFRSTDTPVAAAQPERMVIAPDDRGRVAEPYVPRNSSADALASLLCVPSAGSAALHFTLAPMMHAALSKLCKQLVLVFPLCFNSRWLAVHLIACFADRNYED